MSTENNNIIEVENLVFKYPTLWGLRGINLKIPRGKFTAILGPNGAGKTTLIKLFIKTFDVYQGKIVLSRKNIQEYEQKNLARIIGYVPQELEISYPFLVKDIVTMGRYPYHEFWQGLSGEDRKFIENGLKYTETEEFKDREFNALSGGEKKRVLIASALAQNPKVLLLDEPTNGLDFSHQMQIFSILKEIQKKYSLTIIMVTHDINFAAQFCDNFVFMVNGEIIETGGIDILWNKEMLDKIYNVDFHIIEHPIKDIPLILVKE
ncbi:MAG: ABC transporter ATP-binding protein [Calditrichia bacterium]|nr:ABC transporter ATP-binding protein [Calditrichia bacterium]